MNKKELQSLLVIVLGFLAIGYLFKIEELKFIAMGIGVISIIIPPIGKLIIKGWHYLALGLGWINSRIILTLVFYLFLTPIALISRIFTKDKLKLKYPKDNTLWVTRNHFYTPKDLENPW
jgi:hypothetical protein